VCRYVVLTPVRDKLVKHPKQWKWSRYRATGGQVAVLEFLTVDRVLESFARRAHLAQQRYQAFVMKGIGARFPWDELRGQMYLGCGTASASQAISGDASAPNAGISSQCRGPVC